MSVRRTLPTRADGKADDRIYRKKPKLKSKPIADYRAKMDEVLVRGYANTSPEDLVKAAAPEAIRIIQGIMRKPGRHAQTQLAAAREMLKYGVQEPAKVQTNTNENTHRVQGDINIVLVPAKDGRRVDAE